MQQAVIDELMAARPPGGFPTVENAPEGTLEAYVASNLWWHVRGAMGDAPPAKVLVEHEDLEVGGVEANGFVQVL